MVGISRARSVVLSCLICLTLWNCSTAIPAAPILPSESGTPSLEDGNPLRRSFNEFDATSALQAAIDSGKRRIVVPNMGKPWLVEPICLTSNQEIVLEPGVIIRAKKGSFQGTGDYLLRAIEEENVTLIGYGAVLEMRKEDYTEDPYTFSEWRNAITLKSCRNVNIHGLTIRNSGGDGIYIGRTQEGRSSCENVSIRDVLLENNYRQGISVISARNIVIEDSVIRGTEGTPPQAGIDFEPNKPDEELTDCILRGCIIEDNRGPGFLAVLGHLGEESSPVSITVESCTIVSNKITGIWIIAGQNGVRGHIAFVNCDLPLFKQVKPGSFLTVSGLSD